MTHSKEDSYPNGVFDSLIDDIWIDISKLLNIQDFISFRLCCNQFNKVTHPSKTRINNYWKFACIKLLGALGDGFIQQTKQWYPIFIELHKYVSIHAYTYTNAGISISRKQWKNAILCQPSKISVADYINMRFLESGSMIQLTNKQMPCSEYEWDNIRMFWKHMMVVLPNDLLSVFKILIDCKPFIDDLNTEIYDSTYFHNISFEKLKERFFQRFVYQRRCVTIFSLICSNFDSWHCVKIFDYILSVSRNYKTLLYHGTKALIWILVCNVCNELYQHSPSHPYYSRYQDKYRRYRSVRIKHFEWLKIDHFGIGYKCIETILKKHLDVDSNKNNQTVIDENINNNCISNKNDNVSETECVDCVYTHTKLDEVINFKHYSNSNSNLSSHYMAQGSALDVAISCKRPDIARLLIKYGASMDHIVKNMDIKQKLIQLLSDNISNGEMIQFWIDYFKIDINKFEMNDNGDTILVYAISKLNKKKFDDQQIGYIDTIYCLLNNNPTIDIINQNYDCQGRSVFLQAIDKHCQWTVSNIYNHLVATMKSRINSSSIATTTSGGIGGIGGNMIIDDDQCDYGYNHYNDANTVIKNYINYYHTRSREVDIDHDEKGNCYDEKKDQTMTSTVATSDNNYHYNSGYSIKHKPNREEFECLNGESIYLYVCKQFPSKELLIHKSQMRMYWIYLEEFMKTLPPLIKVLIDIKVDITVKDNKDNKMGSDYICDICDVDDTLATFKQFVQTQESIAVYFKNLDYSIVHVAEKGITPTYAHVSSPTEDNYNENEDIDHNLNAIVTSADSKTLQLINSVTALSLDDNHEI